jgi:hypothetical protein
MQYVLLCWKYEGTKYILAHDLCGEYTTKEVASWMRNQLEDVEYPSFAFEPITKERYDWYFRRKRTTANFN